VHLHARLAHGTFSSTLTYHAADYSPSGPKVVSTAQGSATQPQQPQPQPQPPHQEAASASQLQQQQQQQQQEVLTAAAAAEPATRGPEQAAAAAASGCGLPPPMGMDDMEQDWEERASVFPDAQGMEELQVRGYGHCN